MAALEKFLHRQPEDLPLLVKTALVHVQFETIHPFLDGNGRLGRLLITFLLCVARAIGEPILYLSLYFKTNRQRYYELLDRVRTSGDWETWLEFFLTGVKETAQQAADTSREILKLIEKDRQKIEELGRPAGSVLRVHLHLQRKPIITIPATAEQLSLCTHCGEGFAAYGEARHGSRNHWQTAASALHVSPLPGNSEPRHRTAKASYWR
jgi:cell filamentation protein, protein adenylyltransferase